ncbi:MAG: prolipoprotein diacylglyceryl transferase [Acidimicrobiales bacterium]
MHQRWELLGTIPSPSADTVEVGPLSITAYGVCIALGVLAAVSFARARWRARGGRADDVTDVALWAVPAGIIGARVYHIVNDWRPWYEWIEIWNGGLGIGGGLVGGILTGYLVARRRGLDVAEFLDAAIPAIPIGQALGRFGNWFNQENFGTPTDLPWALRIDAEHRPAGYADHDTFHPAFLYEAAWNVVLVVVLVRLDRRGVLRQGMTLPAYIVGYSVGRLMIEAIRIDPAPVYLGLRFNLWVYGAAVIVGLVWLIRFGGSAPRPPGNAGLASGGEKGEHPVRSPRRGSS